MAKSKQIILAVAIILIVIAGSILIKKFVIPPDSIQLSKIEVTNSQGQTFTLDQLKGKVVVLNFWATWCQPCIAEMPMFQEVYEMMKKQPVSFVFATDDTSDKVEAFLQKYHLNIPVYHLTQGIDTYGIDFIPVTFIFDKSGRLVEKMPGTYDNADELYRSIIGYL